MFDRDTELGAASSTWRAFVLRDDVSCGFWCQPDVLRETVGVDGGNLRMETVRKGDSDVALLPFRSSAGPIPFRVGMLQLGKLRAKMLKLVDYEFALQDGTTREEAFGSAVEQIRAQRSCDLVVADNWALHEDAGDLPLRVTRRHTQATYLIDMPADFDTYFASRSANTRQTLRRRAQGLERKSGCRVSLRVYRKPPEMAALHASLEGVWKNSWHANLGAQAPPTVASLERLSAHGWVRSYVLFADADPIACVQGYQHDGTFYDEAPAYDMGWKQYSPGLVLDYLMLQDLFANAPPHVVDFGFGYNQYKEMLGNRREERCQLWIPTTPRGHAVLAGLRCCDLGFKLGKKVLGNSKAAKRLKARAQGK